MREQHLVFRFTHDSVEYNISTGSFIAVESSVVKQIYGVIPKDKKLSINKDLGCFIWGSRSSHDISELWVVNKAESNNGLLVGSYDDLLDAERDTPVQLYVVTLPSIGDSDFADWELVGEYHIDTVRNSTDDYIVIAMVSKLAFLEKNTANKYFSDTIEYDNNQGQSRPIAIGHCFNAPVKLVDDLDNVFEANNDNGALTIEAAYDNYDPFVLTTDYTVGVISDTGGYGIDLVNQPVGVITADIDGGDYHGLLTEHAGVDISDIDQASLSAIDTEWGGDYGAFLSEPSGIRSLVEKFSVSHCGYTYINQAGQLAFGWLKEPSTTPDYEVNEHYISSNGVDVEPDIAQGLSDGVASKRNWHVFTEGDVEGTVAIGDRDTVTKDYQSYYRSSVTTSGSDVFHDFYAHGRNGDFIETLGSDAVKSKDLIAHLETLYSVKRNFYSFEIIVSDLVEAMKMNVGETIKVTWPRWGLENGKNMIIVGIDYSDLLQQKIRVRGWA